MGDDFSYDVFLSHSSKDKAVVQEVAKRLQADGLKVWFDEWVLKPGDSIPAKVEEGLERSRVLVFCMSANAFGSDWAQLEAGTFRFRDPLNKERRFIPLRLDNAPIKGSLAQFLYINWRPADREQEYAKLLEFCRSPRKPPVAAPQALRCRSQSGVGPSKNLAKENPAPPHRCRVEPDGVPASLRASPPRLIGRERECQLVLETLRNITAPRTVCIDGLGGIGKTALAEEVARRALAEGSITGICWKTAKTERLVGPQIKRLSDDPLAWRTIRADFLRARDERRGERLLFVLDNLETAEGVEELLTEFPSVVGGHAGLLTSRERLHWHQEIRSISLAGLTEKESIEFLRSDAQARSIPVVAGAPERDLRRVASVLEGNPLAMKLVVGLCIYLSLDSILEDLREAKLDRRFKSGSLYAFIYLRAWERLTELARAVLIYVGKTARESIGLKELKDIFQRMGSGERETEDAVAQLVQLCLLDPNEELRADRRRFSLHALTRTFVNTELPELWNRNHP